MGTEGGMTREERAKYYKEWYAKNREKRQAYAKKRAAEEPAEKRRAKARAYYAKNTEKMREKHRKYYAENAEKLAEYRRKWYQENRELVQAKAAEKRQDPDYRAALKEYAKAHRAERKAAGLCIRHGCPRLARPDRTHCEECADLARAKTAEFIKARADSKCCLSCGTPLGDLETLNCKKCCDKKRPYFNAWHRKEYRTRISLGLCVTVGCTEFARQDRRQCQTCADKIAEANRAAYARRRAAGERAPYKPRELTPEQRAAKNAYSREYMRKRREKLRDSAATPETNS